MLKAVHDKDASAAPTAEAIEYDSRLVLLAGRCVVLGHSAVGEAALLTRAPAQ